MKILMIAPDAQMIDRRILQEAKTLTEKGHHVRLLSGFECGQEMEYEEDGIPIHRYNYDWDDERLKKIRAKLPDNDTIKMFVNRAFMIPANRRVFGLTPFEMYMASKLMEFEADIIHVHDLPCLSAGVYAAKKRGIPLVFDAHELYYAQDTLTKKQQGFYRQYEKKYIRNAAKVITVNPFIAGLMAERDGIPEPAVILNATEEIQDVEALRRESPLREKARIPSDAKVFLYQGWISPERNIDSIVRSAKYLREDIYLVLIGYGAYLDALKDICMEEQIEDRVRFLGEIPNAELYNYTAGADLGVIPYEPIDENHLYCSPNKLFEFVVSGLPFICNDLPFLKHIKDTYNVLETCEMKNPKAIAETVNRIVCDPDALAQMRARCIIAAKELNWRVEGEKLTNIYEDLQERYRIH